MKRPLFWKVYPYYFVVILLSLILVALFGAREMRKMYLEQVTTTLEARARIAERLLAPLVLANDIDPLNRECRIFSQVSATRITVVDASGVVLSDSHEDPLAMENHGARPEIVIAYTGDVGVRTRFSNTLQADMMYVAIPMNDNNKVVAVIRVALPVSAVEGVLSSFYWKVTIGGAVILALAALFSIAVLRRLTGPLRDLRDGASHFAAGKFDSRLPVSTTEEIADLSESMSEMGRQLDARIRTIAQQRNEREAILSSMSEGILALDTSEKIVAINKTAAEFLDLDIDDSHGKPLYEVLRIPIVLEFVEAALNSTDTTEMEFVIPGATERCFQARAAALHDSAGEMRGVVVVFNDITRLKRLESIRRDFVANVSHELRTPITAIAASVETLIDGAADKPEDRRQFLEMIARHSDRLTRLIEDLLSLARIESLTEQAATELTPGYVKKVIESAVMACQEESKLSRVTVSLTCPDSLQANINAEQLEQAITNLIDNAVKYSDPGSTVTVEGIAGAEDIRIVVRDTGIGIAEQHLSRLFERFYRVDKSRSRDAGGTGLGLAIVKHAAAAHHGRVSVESAPGQGSVFSIHLPKIQ